MARITVPEGSYALILTPKLAEELWSLCQLVRKDKKLARAHGIAQDVLVALIDAGVRS